MGRRAQISRSSGIKQTKIQDGRHRLEEVILKMKNIKKEFSGVFALSDVTLSVNRGEIHGLMGGNGSGKSTLMNILSGFYPFGSYEGQVIYDGEECHFRNIRDSEKKGIVIIHQELSLIPGLSVAENIFLGNERKKRPGIIDWEATYREAAEWIGRAGGDIDVRSLVSELGAARAQLVEIMKALSKDVKLLILDEPTSSLNDEEAKKLLDLLLELKQQGITSIIITHKLNELVSVADRITVIRDGETIGTLENKDHDVDEDLIVQYMVGRKLKTRYPQREHRVSDEIALDVAHYTVYLPETSKYYGKKSVDDVSFYVRKGEVVGLAGLQGSGRSRLCKSLFGRYGSRLIEGDVTLLGEKVRFSNPKEAIKGGLSYVTENRSRNGLLFDNPIVNNITLSALDLVTGRHVIERDKEIRVTQTFVQDMAIKAKSSFDKPRFMSGGNQQKVLLAKWIFTDSAVLILDEPTKGIDVNAKYEIYSIINRLVEKGKAVILISSEMADLLGMCDRIYVMNEGRMIAEFAASEASREKIMQAILRDNSQNTEE